MSSFFSYFFSAKFSNAFPVEREDSVDGPEVIHATSTALFYQTNIKALSFEQMYELYGGRKGLKMKNQILKQIVKSQERNAAIRQQEPHTQVVHTSKL